MSMKVVSTLKLILYVGLLVLSSVALVMACVIIRKFYIEDLSAAQVTSGIKLLMASIFATIGGFCLTGIAYGSWCDTRDEIKQR